MRLVCSLLLLWAIPATATTQSDSLWSVWTQESKPDTERLEALELFVRSEYMYSNEDSAIFYSQKLYDFAEQSGHKSHMASAMNIMAGAVVNRDVREAREYLFRGLALAEEVEDNTHIMKCVFNIGNTYFYQNEYSLALQHWQRASKMAEEYNDTKLLISLNEVMGNLYKAMGYLERAAEVYSSGVVVLEEQGNFLSAALTLNNLGHVLAELGDTTNAIQAYTRALTYAEQSNNLLEQATSHIGLLILDDQNTDSFKEHLQSAERLVNEGDLTIKKSNLAIFKGHLALKNGNFRTAINECNDALSLAQAQGVLQFQAQACACLYSAYKSVGNGALALEYHERLLILNDSLQSQKVRDQLQRLDFEKQLLADSLEQEQESLMIEVAHKDEVRKKNRQRNILIGSGLLLALLAIALWSRLRYIRRSKAVLQIEKDRSESLLLNILPAEIAEELKVTGKATARNFDMVSIIFTDFKEFTETSERLSPEELVDELNYCFQGFDAIMDKYGIEKIKTIGDAYMAASGLPMPRADSVKNAVLASIEMQQFIANRKAGQISKGHLGFEMRAGIHTGPVVAGIVGVKKFQYDIWGDTVNTASRIEGAGEIGRVNISHNTWVALKDDPDFTFEKRGNVQVKGKGTMDMYFVSMA